MHSRFSRPIRSTESPMDFEFTNRPTSNIKPAWVEADGDPSTPRKRSLNEMNPPPSPFPSATPHTPTFGRIQNVPFIFNTPPPASQHVPAWVPPSPTKPIIQSELRDVDMSEASPPVKSAAPASPEKPSEQEQAEERAIATGGMRRVYKSRQKTRERSQLAVVRQSRAPGEEIGDDESEDDEGWVPVTHTTANHYTLNVPAPAPPKSDTPFVLLGYLQVFFNLFLILVCLYLLVLFILTVQRDVEHRVSEYSMDVVQEIAQCAMHHRENLCEKSPIPAMLHQCALWKTCMDRDPSKIGRAKVVAEMIAEVVNGFVEPISWKTLFFTLSSLAFLTAFINTLPSFFRPKSPPAAAPAHSIPPFPLSAAASYHPHHLLGAASHPDWNKSWKTITSEVGEVPSRRRKLESGSAKDIM